MLISELIKTVNEYFQFRGLTEPTFQEACKFVMTEAGELLNASTRLEDKWLRNNPLDAEEAERQFRYEIGDCLCMLVKTYEKAGLEDYDLLLENEYAEYFEIEDLLPYFVKSCADLYWQAGRKDDKSGLLSRCFENLINIASYYDLNPYDCMIEKFASKGFVVGDLPGTERAITIKPPAKKVMLNISAGETAATIQRIKEQQPWVEEVEVKIIEG